jgi:hypothetical protein
MCKIYALALCLGAVLTLAPRAGAECLAVFRSEDGNFSVMLPGTPKKLPQNSVANSTTYALDEGNGNAYIMTYSDMAIRGKADEATAQGILDRTVQGMARAGNFLSSSKVKMSGPYLGRELLLKTGPNLTRVRVCLVGKRMYQVGAVGSRTFVYSDTADTVLNSFRVLGAELAPGIYDEAGFWNESARAAMNETIQTIARRFHCKVFVETHPDLPADGARNLDLSDQQAVNRVFTEWSNTHLTDIEGQEPGFRVLILAIRKPGRFTVTIRELTPGGRTWTPEEQAFAQNWHFAKIASHDIV